MKGYDVSFKVYADSQEEADMASLAIKVFINELAGFGRAVSAKKIISALKGWKNNVFIKGKILEFFR